MFSFEAMDPQGNDHKGYTSESNRDLAQQRIREEGYFVTKISPLEDGDKIFRITFENDGESYSKFIIAKSISEAESSISDEKKEQAEITEETFVCSKCIE